MNFHTFTCFTFKLCIDGFHYVQPKVMAAVKAILQDEQPGLLIPTPSPQELWSRPKGKRDAILDDLVPEGGSMVGVQLRPPTEAEESPVMDCAHWKQYHCLEPFRLWWYKASTGEFFFEDDAASRGWQRYTEEHSRRQWYHQLCSDDWFFVDTGMRF